MAVLDLVRLWNGAPAPAGLGGRAEVVEESGVLVFSWSVGLAAAPRTPRAEPGFHDFLWEHDVVELFLASPSPGGGRTQYLEVEAGPAGHWLALGFEGVRCRVAELREETQAPESEILTVAGRLQWTGRMVLGPEALAWAGPGPWTGLACLVAGEVGSRAHVTSARLPGDRPDFHQPRAWPTLDEDVIRLR